MQCEIYLVVDSEGNYSVGSDLDSARDAYDADNNEPIRRVVCLTVELPTPQKTAVNVSIPADKAGTPIVSVK